MECVQTDYLILINEEHRLPNDFEDTIELVTDENAVGDKVVLEKKTYEAFLRLREDILKNDGIQIEAFSTYRSVKEQEAVFERYLKNFGLEYTKKYVAIPGHSEHHTGIALDAGILLDGKFYRTVDELLSVDHLFQIVQSKLPQYGMILRYPKGKEAITKIGYEPWHFRYIDSPELAKEITDKGICFEEYWKDKMEK